MPTISAMLSTRDARPRDGSTRASIASAPRATVATLVLPLERQRVEAAGMGCYATLHRDSVDELIDDLRTQRARGVVLSVARYHTQDCSHVARLVREFPRVPAVALLTATEPKTTQTVLSLGRQGVTSLVDVRDANGWKELRELFLAEQRDAIEQVAIRTVSQDLAGAGDDMLRFIEALFLAPSRVVTVQQLTRMIGVLPTTFMSRFFRAALPSPKRYLAMARLVRVARLLENPGLSITHVTNHLEYSSPQSFSRHVQLTLGVTGAEFRRQFDGLGMLSRFRTELILPHVATLRNFEPFATVPGWSVLREKPAARVAEPKGGG